MFLYLPTITIHIGANGAKIPTGGFLKQSLAFGSITFTQDFLKENVGEWPFNGLTFYFRAMATVIDKY